MLHPIMRCLALVGLVTVLSSPAPGQSVPGRASDGGPGEAVLDRLVRDALARSPELDAVRARADAARERVVRAGAWSDPELTLGLRNFPASTLSPDEEPMAQRFVQVGQRIPLPGKLGSEKRRARHRAGAAEHATTEVRLDVAARVKRRYAELHFLEHALRVTDENLRLLASLEEATRTAYVTGRAEQPDLLRAGVEIEDLRGRRLALSGRREEALARLNELRRRPASTPVDAMEFPPSLLTLLETRPDDVEFASALAVTSDFIVPGLPGPDSLVSRALEANPVLSGQRREIDAHAADVDRARSGRWPDPTLRLGFGQRDVRSNLLTVGLSARIPLFAGRRQDAVVRERRALRSAAEGRYLSMAGAVERQVAAAYAHLRHAYGQSRLVRSGMLARAEATFEATLAAYRSGTQDFPALLDSQALVYRYELEYHRRMADFLAAWAELEQAVGEELTP